MQSCIYAGECTLSGAQFQHGGKCDSSVSGNCSVLLTYVRVHKSTKHNAMHSLTTSETDLVLLVVGVHALEPTQLELLMMQIFHPELHWIVFPRAHTVTHKVNLLRFTNTLTYW